MCCIIPEILKHSTFPALHLLLLYSQVLILSTFAHSTFNMRSLIVSAFANSSEFFLHCYWELMYVVKRSSINDLQQLHVDVNQYFLFQAVVNILQEMPSGPYGKMVEWFYRLSKHAKVQVHVWKWRIFSLFLSLFYFAEGYKAPNLQIPKDFVWNWNVQYEKKVFYH